MAENLESWGFATTPSGILVLSLGLSGPGSHSPALCPHLPTISVPTLPLSLC